jgi:hypothetical protein
MIIGVSGAVGGQGRSTTAAGLAVCAMRAGHAVTLIDAGTDWHASRVAGAFGQDGPRRPEGSLAVVQADPRDETTWFSAAAGTGLVIIDGPWWDKWFLEISSDLVIVPTHHGPRLIAEVRRWWDNPAGNIPAWVVLTRVSRPGAFTRAMVDDARDELDGRGLHVLDAVVRDSGRLNTAVAGAFSWETAGDAYTGVFAELVTRGLISPPVRP